MKFLSNRLMRKCTDSWEMDIHSNLKHLARFLCLSNSQVTTHPSDLHVHTNSNVPLDPASYRCCRLQVHGRGRIWLVNSRSIWCDYRIGSTGFLSFIFEEIDEMTIIFHFHYAKANRMSVRRRRYRTHICETHANASVPSLISLANANHDKRKIRRPIEWICAHYTVLTHSHTHTHTTLGVHAWII